jgi:hypothetical protein
MNVGFIDCVMITKLFLCYCMLASLHGQLHLLVGQVFMYMQYPKYVVCWLIILLLFYNCNIPLFKKAVHKSAQHC